MCVYMRTPGQVVEVRCTWILDPDTFIPFRQTFSAFVVLS